MLLFLIYLTSFSSNCDQLSIVWIGRVTSFLLLYGVWLNVLSSNINFCHCTSAYIVLILCPGRVWGHPSASTQGWSSPRWSGVWLWWLLCKHRWLFPLISPVITACQVNKTGSAAENRPETWPRLNSLYIFCLGATRTKGARELLYARQKVVVTTKAFGLQAIDLVYIDYKDADGLRQQAREGALMGFTGDVRTVWPRLGLGASYRSHSCLVVVYLFLYAAQSSLIPVAPQQTSLVFCCERNSGNLAFEFSFLLPRLVCLTPASFQMRIGNELADKF